MLTRDWLKPLKKLTCTRFTRQHARTTVRGAVGTDRWRAIYAADVARGERLEDRLLLSAVVATQAAAVDLVHDHVVDADAAPWLPTQYQITGAGRLLTGPTEGAPMEIAQSFLRSHAAELGLQPADVDQFVVSSQYTDDRSGTTHIYLRQTHGGLEVMNADLSIGISARGEVIQVVSSFVGDPRATESTGSQVIVDASRAFLELSDDLQLGVTSTPQMIGFDADSLDRATLLSTSGSGLEDVPARLVYVPAEDGLHLAWQLDVQSTDYRKAFIGFVDADSGRSIYVADLVNRMSYNVYASPLRSPSDGGRSIQTNPSDVTASPFGWHDTDGVSGAEFTDTRGNNVEVQEDADANDTGGFRPDGGAGLTFDFPVDTTQNPANYQSAAITNMFFWVNRLHDIHYQYGFTEAAGNFQTNNYGRGGLGNDAVIADVQDGSGGGPAFVTQPDGQSPRMSMYLNSTVSPARDAAFDNTVLIHEYGHGVSERLTGGPANNSALNATQSGGMGEGWSDWWSIMLTQTENSAQNGAYPVGTWYFGQAADGVGARRFPYSYDMTVNPLTMSDYNNSTTRSSRHKTGEIWASALWDMNWLLVNKHGFSSDYYNGNGGNNLALQLVMDGLKLQGTNPSYLTGRDAILTADVALTGGQNQAEIWAAFARRGMGFSAVVSSSSATSVTQAFDVPGMISGTVFRDDDGNGVKGGSEPGLAGRTVYRDLNNNGVIDVASVSTFNSTDTDTPRAIPDQANIKSPIAISGLSGTIVDVNITVNITHPKDSELNLALLPPSGTPVILAQFLGGTGANYTNTVFDDEAATYITSATAPFTGSFKPYFNLAQLDGASPNGTWQLRIDDVAAGNSGTLLSWSMQVTYGSPDPTAVTDAGGSYVFFGTGDGTHRIREVVPTGYTQTAPAGGINVVVISSGVPVTDQNFGNRVAAAIANVSTLEDTLSSAIAITPPAGLGITHFKVSGIADGTLFKNDGSTGISNGDFITFADGQAGVKFLPSANSNVAGRFDIELSQNGSSVLADGSLASGTVSVTPVGDTPQVASLSTLQNTLSGPIVISRHAADGAEVTHFRISGITSGTLFKNDGTTQIFNGGFITFAEGQAGVKFRPTTNSTTTGTFDGESSQNGSSVAAQSGKATSSISITPIGFTIAQTSGSTIVSESGTTDTFTAVLTAQPNSNVVLSVVSSDLTEATVSPAMLTFTPASWNVAQTVTVTGVDDSLIDGSVVSTVTVSVVAALSDDAFDPLPDQTVSVTTMDDDVARPAVVSIETIGASPTNADRPASPGSR
jgi:subtilisin-like proprotein convertase family protein